MDDENKKDEPKVQADNNSVAVGGINIGGSVGGNITIGHSGYTSEEVSVLITQIKSTFQPRPFDGRCPYKGLDVFEEEDAELFFGREKLVKDLVGRVKDTRTLFVTGPSGSGKSSLVRAGLIHALKEGAIKNSERWLYETIRPGRDPIGELGRVASSLASSTNAEDEIRAKALADSTIFARWCEIALKDSRDKRAVIFIDQFEEIFTQINKEEERVAFLNLLTHAATVENGRVILLFAMRSDFVSNCATYPKLNELLNQQFIQIGAMQPEELVSAMAQPALRVGLRIDPDLIAQVINDMKGEPGALPLMQFAMKELFDAQQTKGGVIALTLSDYLKHGGIDEALERHADDSLAKLSEHEQALARNIFSGLIEIGRGTQDTRRTALFNELVPASSQAEDVQRVVQKLADARLVTTEEKDSNKYTITHEKLIEAWPWLKKLVNENRDVIALQNEIASDAKEWNDHQRDTSYLYSGARLVNVHEKLGANKLVLSGMAHEFVQAGKARQRKSQVVLIGGVSTIIALLVIAVIVFGNQSNRYLQVASTAQAANTEAIAQKGTAQANAEEALARQLAAQAQSVNARKSSNQMIAALIDIQSMKLFPTGDAASFLLNDNLAAHTIARMTHDDRVTAVAFSPDGKYIVSTSSDDIVRVWEAATEIEIARMTHDTWVFSVAFSPDSRYVVSGSEDLTARVWEAATGVELARMTHDDGVSSVTFSPDGKYIVSGSYDGTARVWEAATGMELARITHDDGVNSVAFSPDGKYVVSGSKDVTARVWETATGLEVARMTHDDQVTAVAFSPDGEYVVSAGGYDDATARVWEVATGAEVARMIHDAWVTSVAFSPDGRYVVSGSYDGTARGWLATTGKEVARMTHDKVVSSMAFSPDGRYVVSGSEDGTARVWEATTGKEVARMTHDKVVNSVANVYSVAFSPDGKYVVSGGYDGTARVWEAATGIELARMIHDGSVISVAFSPDGRYVVSGSEDGTARVWEATTGKEVARMTHNSGVSSVAFSPDGRNVVSGSEDVTARVWEATTGKELARMIHDTWVKSVAFSPNGKYVVSGDAIGTVRVWEAATGVELAHMTHDTWVISVAFSPNGKYVISGGCDEVDAGRDCKKGSGRIWEVATGAEVARMIHDDDVSSVAFSPDGRYVVSGGYDGTARVWEATTGKEVARMTHNSGVSSVAFSLDGKYIISGSYDGTARVWEAATGIELARMARDDNVISVAFSPDGRYVVSGSGIFISQNDNAARVWEASTGKEVARMNHDDAVTSVAFSPDGKYIVSGSHDGTAHAWEWQADDLIAEACANLPRNLTRAEWGQYIGDVPPYPTKQEDAICPNLPIEPEPTPIP